MVQGAGLLADGPGIRNRTKTENGRSSCAPWSPRTPVQRMEEGRCVCLIHAGTLTVGQIQTGTFHAVKAGCVSFFALQIDSSYDLVGKSLELARTVIPEKSRPTSPHWGCLRTRVTDSAKSS